ncbi:MAG: succinate dehydrogenase cytochrome b558 subunit [Planctomycetota bacterium]
MTQRGKDFLFVRVVVSERKLSVSEHAMEPTSSQDKHYFLVRRLHSLSGLVPVGVFLCVHLSANATVLVGADEFQRSVDRIHSLGPLLVPVEIVGIFIPLLFHALLGFQIIFTSKSNAQQYRYGSNVRYTAQRTTGVIAFVFILYHVWQMHWFGTGVGGGQFAAHDASGAPAAAETTAAALQSAWWIAPAYAVGVASCVYHLANGVWTSLITWGITIRPRSQQVAGYFCAAFGFILLLVGLGALRGFKTLDAGKSSPPTVAEAIANVGEGDGG